MSDEMVRIALTRYDSWVDRETKLSYDKGVCHLVDAVTAKRLIKKGCFEYVGHSDCVPRTHAHTGEPLDAGSSAAFSALDGIEHISTGDAIPVHVVLSRIQESDNLNGKRVLFIRNAAIGDTVFVATVAKYLKDRFPKVAIALGVKKEHGRFIAGYDHIDQVVSVEQASNSVFVESFDYVIQFGGVIEGQHRDENDYFVRHFERMGYVPADIESGPKFTLTVMALASDCDTSRSADRILRDAGIGNEPYVVVLPETSNNIKTVYKPVMVDMLKRMAEGQSGRKVRVLVVGSKADKKFKLEHPWLSYALGQPLEVSAELVRRSEMVVGGDTGLLQFAASIGIPTVALFGPTNPEFSILHYTNVHVVKSTEPCSPCMFTRVSFCPHLDANGNPACMRRVEPTAVLEMMQRVWEKKLECPNRNFSRPEILVAQASEISKAYSAKDVNVAVLMDLSDSYTGGGFYTYHLARMMATRPGYKVCVFHDRPSVIFKQDDVSENQMSFIHDPHVREWTGPADSNMVFDLVVGTPPATGACAVGYAKAVKGAKSICLMYECPNYVAKYRRGIDAGEKYWETYKLAMADADHIITISHIVKKELLEWLPAVKGKVGVICPVINHEAANAVNVGPTTGELSSRRGIMLLSRNVPYKGLGNALTVVAKDFALQYVTGDVDIYVVGMNVSMLAREIDSDWEKQGVRVHLLPHITEKLKWELLNKCRAMVHSSEFEGFGIPPAEAMYAGVPCLAHPLPVFKEAYKDNLYYYTDNASLVAGLVRLWSAWETTPDALIEYAEAARKYVSLRYTIKQSIGAFTTLSDTKFKDLAENAEKRALAAEKKQAIAREERVTAVRVALVTTWNDKCGIAETTKQWAEKCNATLRVFSPSTEVKAESKIQVVQCWRKRESLTDLTRQIIDYNPSIVHIQHEFSFYDTVQLCRMISTFRGRGIRVVCTFHTNVLESEEYKRILAEVDIPVFTKRFNSELPTSHGMVINLPAPNAPSPAIKKAREGYGRDLENFDGTIVGAFGLWAPHKGFDTFLRTYADTMARLKGRGIKYLISGYRTSNNLYAQRTSREFASLVLRKNIILDSSYDDFESTIAKLAVCDMFVFNYDVNVQFSASSGIRTAMAAKRPIICTDCNMFSEFEHGVHVLKVPVGDHAALVDTICNVAEGKVDNLKKMVLTAAEYVKYNSPKIIAERHENLYMGA